MLTNKYKIHKACEDGHLEVIKFLVEKGVNIIAKDNYTLK